MSYSLLELAQREIDLSRLARIANQQLEGDHYPAGRIRSGGLKSLRLSASVVSLATTTTSEDDEDDDYCSGSDVDDSLSEYSDSISIYSSSSFAASLAANIGDEARVYTNPLAIETMTSVASGSREEQPIADEEFERALDAFYDEYDWTAVTIDDDDDDEKEEEESDDDDDEFPVLLPSMMKPLDVYLAPWTSLIEGSMVESESDEDDEDDGVYIDLIYIPSTHTKKKTKTETPAATAFAPNPMSKPVTHDFEFAQRYFKPLSDAGLQVPSSDNLGGQDAGLPLLREIILEMVVKYEEGEEDHQRRWGLKAGWKGVKKWVGRKFDKLRDIERS